MKLKGHDRALYHCSGFERPIKPSRFKLEAFSGDMHDDVERLQQLAFTGVPLVGAEGIVLFVAGNRDHPVLICAEIAGFG